jgi:C-terminal processing protease CtpA/Prc
LLAPIKAIVLSLLLVVVFTCATAFAQDDSTRLSVTEKVYGLSLFWKEVSYNFAYFDQIPDLDWDSAYQEFIPRVIATESTYDYYRELQRFCALLTDGHTTIYFPPSVNAILSYPKLLLAEYDHRMYVRNVDSNLATKIPIGSEITMIDGKPTVDFVKNDVMPYISASAEHVLWDLGIRWALRGIKGSTIILGYRTPDGTEMTGEFERNRNDVRWLRPIEDRQLMKSEWLDDDIAYVELNSFSDPSIVAQFEEFLPELYKSKGIIIDLRHNQGGSSRTATNILQHFSSDTLWGSMWRTREHIAVYKAWGYWDNKEGKDSELIPYYNGDAWHQGNNYYTIPDSGRKIDVPVVVLFGRKTGSAAEDFLVYADELEQFLYVGEPSNGSTGQPLTLEGFPGGGQARVCSKRDTFRDGRDFVGYGVQPDVMILETVATLLDGSDPVFERGLEEMQNMLKDEKQDK